MDIVLLLGRLLLGLGIAGHGFQKLLGWFGGPGLTGVYSERDKLVALGLATLAALANLALRRSPAQPQNQPRQVSGHTPIDLICLMASICR